jgi:hypothetical protein
LFVDREQFPYHPKPSRILQRTTFCADCHAEKVQPELDKYAAVAEAAESVLVIRKSYRGFVPTLRKENEVHTVKRHLAERLAIRHLQFHAAWFGWNALVQLETTFQKVRNHGYEHKEWTASATFAHVDLKRFRPVE